MKRTYELHSFWIHNDEFMGMHETSNLVIFLADSHGEALDSMLRYVDNRKEALPEWFTELCCLKLSVKTIGYIDQQGALTTTSHLPFFEWKCDFPCPPKAYTDVAKQRTKK